MRFAIYGCPEKSLPVCNILQGNGAVLKVLKDSNDFGSAREQILRIKEAHELLKAAKAANPSIEFAEIVEFHENADPPYLIQGRLTFDGKEYKQIQARDLVKGTYDTPLGPVGNPFPFSEIAQKFPLELREAVVELYFALAQHRLIGWDLSLPNIYFRNVRGKWVAGILDIDHIVHCKRPKTDKAHATWKEIRNIRDKQADKIPSLAVDGRELKTTVTFMEKAFELEYGGNKMLPWILYDEEHDLFVPVLIEPELIAKRFPDFKIRGLLSGASKKRSWLRPIQPWPGMSPVSLPWCASVAAVA